MKINLDKLQNNLAENKKTNESISTDVNVDKSISEGKSWFNSYDLSIAGFEKFYKIKSNDYATGSSATMLSSACYGAKITYTQKWSERTKGYLAYDITSVGIKESSSTSKTIVNRENLLSEYSFGIEYRYSSNLKIVNSLSYSESLVNRAINSSIIQVEKFSTPKINSEIQYKVYQKENLILKAIAGVSVLIPSSQETYNSRISFGEKLGFGLLNKAGPLDLEGQVFFQNTDLKMDSAKFNQTEIGLVVGIKKDFGEI